MGKIMARQFRHQAYVHVRQSSLAQVPHHHERTQR
jgi:hypothetical protein